MEKHKAAAAWLKTGKGLPITSEISRAFDDYLNQLPWAGTTALDWSKMPASQELNVVGKSPADVFEWIKTTRLGAHSHIAIWYSRDDGGVVVPTQAGVFALDEFYLYAPGIRFSFGVDLDKGGVRPFFCDLLQYGYGDLLVATC
jgi:hypothetical protein